MLAFKVADISIKISSDSLVPLNSLRTFSSSDEGKSDLIINLNRNRVLSKPKGYSILGEGIEWFCNPKENGKTSVYIGEEGGGKILSILDVDEHWCTATIRNTEADLEGMYSIAGPAGEILFRNHLLFHDGIVVHAAAIECEGVGVIFTAPSGTGKTTQAELWRKHKGARVLNGDRPAIKMVANTPYIYGTPWSGSSKDFINSRAPLTAIIILEQYSENKIVELTKQEAVSRLLPRCFLPYFNNNLMCRALNNIEKILSGTTVYLLKCKPNVEAVELVYQCVK